MASQDTNARQMKARPSLLSEAGGQSTGRNTVWVLIANIPCYEGIGLRVMLMPCWRTAYMRGAGLRTEWIIQQHPRDGDADSRVNAGLFRSCGIINNDLLHDLISHETYLQWLTLL